MGFLFKAKTRFNFSELERIHREAFDVYQLELKSEDSERDARMAISAKNLPNIDVWEHQSLVPIPNDTSFIEELSESGLIVHSGLKYEVIPYSVLPLKYFRE
tara:strand:+ start:11001 stop:11306 length:306 start_codon:yes stop_codon:yes gene_type:complete